MKTIPVALATHFALTCTTVCTCLYVLRGSTELGFTTLDHPITISGITYEPGFDVSQLSASEGLAVDNLELTILPDEVTVRERDIIAGRWDGAYFEVFEVNYESLSDGRNVLKRGYMGEMKMTRGKFVVEFRGLSQALQQTQGILTSKTCRARLGDAKCRVSLATYTGTLTHVTDKTAVTDSGRSDVDDFFGEGLFTMTSGDNIGVQRRVRSFAAGAFVLWDGLPFAPVVGDTYSVQPGCRKRRDEDCVAKFDNAVNFQGEPDLPGLDALVKK